MKFFAYFGLCTIYVIVVVAAVLLVGINNPFINGIVFGGLIQFGRIFYNLEESMKLRFRELAKKKPNQ